MAAYQMKESPHFTMWYTPSDEAVVDMVLETAESAYQPVTAFFRRTIPQRVPLILHASRDELRQAMGWRNDKSAVGVYWQGTIRLLSPSVWINAADHDQLCIAYQRLNPTAHELTHYFLDYVADGNYPHWFSEGLAQWVEYNQTGYLWIEPQSSLRQELYSYDDLQRRFDQLTNQPLAYRESYLLVAYLVEQFGRDHLQNLVDRLAQGESFDEAIHAETGRRPAAFYEEWCQWVQVNLDMLEAAS